MIKFFRGIRQRMLSESKFSRYLIYAIGEIILVVIGILLALQINDWNDARKSAEYEKKIISLINQNLESDSLALSAELTKAIEGVTYTDSILTNVSADKISDTLDIWLGTVVCFERFKSKSSGFEVLKARGIETISDNNIQQALISYYDENLYSVYQALDDVEQSFKVDWLPVLKTDIQDFVWREKCQPVDPEAFFKKSSTITLLKIFQDNRRGCVRRLESALNKIAEIRSLSKS